MADRERRLYGGNWGQYQARVPVYGNVEIDRGDLLFLDSVNGLRTRGTSTASFRAFPFSKVSGSTLSLSSNVELAATNFLGVAAWHSDNGVTEELGVWTHGLFEFPLKSARFAKPLLRVLPCGSGVTLYNQKVQVDTSGSTKYIGLCAEYGQFKANAQVILRSRKLDGWTLD